MAWFSNSPHASRGTRHDLELVPVRISPIERLAHAVVARAGERARLGERALRTRQVLDGGHLPGQVVQAHRAARRTWRLGADFEEAEIVVVLASRRAHEGSPHARRALQLLESKDAVVEVGGPVHVPNEEDRVIQSRDGKWHGDRLPAVCELKSCEGSIRVGLP